MVSKPPLTPKKAQWVKNRKVTLRGNRLNYNAAQQKKYENELMRLVRDMTKDTHSQLFALFKGRLGVDYFKQQKQAAAMDDSLGSQARILMNFLTNKYTKLFAKRSKALVENMLDATLQYSKVSLHSSLKQLSGGLSLKTGVVPEGMEDVAKAIIEENVSLIESIPEQYFKDITGSVMRSITTGRGLSDLVPELSKYTGQVDRRTRNLALDQTRKAYNSINKQRMVKLGIKKFEWIHSGGSQFPRKSHQKIDGVIFSFENLYEEQKKLGVPESDRGLPGNPVNCKCTILPIIEFDEDE